MAEPKGPRSAGMKIDSKLVRELADMLAETGLTEIEVEDGDRKIRVSRGATAAPAAVHAAPASLAAPAAPVAAPAEAPAPAPADDSKALRSPMVGTVYLSPEPGSDAFVKVGDRVKAGDTLLIVEAMKVMNPITATTEGTVQQVYVDNGQPVEFDQPLMLIA